MSQLESTCIIMEEIHESTCIVMGVGERRKGGNDCKDHEKSLYSAKKEKKVHCPAKMYVKRRFRKKNAKDLFRLSIDEMEEIRTFEPLPIYLFGITSSSFKEFIFFI